MPRDHDEHTSAPHVPDVPAAAEVVPFPHPRPASDASATSPTVGAPGVPPEEEPPAAPAPAPVRPGPDGSGAGQAATAPPPDDDTEAVAGVVVDENGNPLPVDPPEAAHPGRRAAAQVARQRPVIPAWARSGTEFRDAALFWARYYGHTAAFHTTRAPVYAAKLAARSPLGVAKMVAAASRWVGDAEGIPVRLAAVRREDAQMYLHLSRQRDTRVRARTILACIAAPLLLVAAVLLAGAPGAYQWPVLAVLVAVCGWIGTPADKPVLGGPAVIDGRPPKLTGDVVIRALAALGIAQVNAAFKATGGRDWFPAPIVRDGPGWRAEVDLPFGVTVADVLDRREALASGLRRPVGCVWPEPAAEAHAGRLVLWVGDQDMNKAAPVPWPLAKAGTVDLFAPIPVGTDPRGRIVKVTLMETNVLIGSLPGGGKTATARVYELAAALDVTAELWVFNLKNNNDHAPAAKVAHRYAAGIDDPTIEQALRALRDLKAEIARRSGAMKKLPLDLCPDGKVTRELANRKSLGLHPLVMILDECQNLFTHPLFKAEAGELAEYVIKLGRALGIVLILATQRPDAKSLPTGVTANVGVRFCLRVMGQMENDMILGTSMYQNGVRATIFRRSDKGIGYLVGEADDPQIVRSAYLDIPTADRIAERARAARIAAGRLAGFAAGQDTPTGTPDKAASLLDDLAAVVPAGEDAVWLETIAARLAELRPDAYGQLDARALGAALRPYGFTVKQVWGIDAATGAEANRRGITRTQITEQLTARSRKREPR
jgi:S-DNA-T family DNA segregation ATPase FtsK/SpoIIIE